MPSFVYTAIDKAGVEMKGNVEAENKADVIQQVKRMGLIPVEIEEQSIWNRNLEFNFERKPSSRDLSIFCRQFVSMTKAGVTIIDAMRMLVEQTENKTLKKAAEALRASLEKGESLASSMKEHPKIFPGILNSMVAAGEASGSLDVAMERMSTQFEKTAKNQGMVKKAMIYPMVVGVVAIAVIVVMLVIVIPSYSQMFEDLNTELPAITQMVLGASNFLKARWMVIVAVVAAAVVGIKVYLSTEEGKRMFSKLQFMIPGVKNLVIKSASANMARTLGTLISAGVPLVEAVDIVANTMQNVLIREALLNAKDQIMIGVPLSDPLRECGLFPPMVYHMIRIGEEAGTTEEMLTKLADYFDEEVELAVQSLMAAMEPMIIVVLAAIVGVMVISILLPMMSMYDSVNALG